MRSIAQLVGLAAASALPASAQQLFRSVPGPAASAQFGKACITIPDQNGDGYKDLLVGAPGFNQQRGAVYCLSGAYLASGVGTQLLWSLTPTANQGDLFGTSLAMVSDVTGDGVADLVVGQPGYDSATQNDVGAIRLINGNTHAIESLIYGTESGGELGSAMAACGDVDGDGKTEVAVGAPGPLAASNGIWFILGSRLQQSGTALSAQFSHNVHSSNTGYGASIASGFDLDGNGHEEIAVGVPGWDAPGATDAGAVVLLSTTVISLYVIGQYTSSVAGEHLGQALDAKHDYDGDGVVDIVVGAPNSPGPNNTQAGRAVVLSGARLLAQTPPYEIYSFFGSQSQAASFHFGTAVCASGDLNNDGIGDFLVGSPDFFQPPFGLARGGVGIFSGATGIQIGGFAGSNGDHLGDALAGAVDDLDGDGFKEFVVAGSLSDAGGIDSGVIKAYRLFPCASSIYCTGKINSLGCTPAIAFSGSPSASLAAPFLITASNFINQKTGLLFYSHGPASTVFQGGFKCAGDPVRRSGALNSGGSSSGSDCTGTYSLDFNARIQGGVDASLVAGAEIFAQYWSRDPQTASHTSLSNAVRFLINP